MRRDYSKGLPVDAKAFYAWLGVQLDARGMYMRLKGPYAIVNKWKNTVEHVIYRKTDYDTVALRWLRPGKKVAQVTSWPEHLESQIGNDLTCKGLQFVVLDAFDSRTNDDMRNIAAVYNQRLKNSEAIVRHDSPAKVLEDL